MGAQLISAETDAAQLPASLSFRHRPGRIGAHDVTRVADTFGPGYGRLLRGANCGVGILLLRCEGNRGIMSQRWRRVENRAQ